MATLEQLEKLAEERIETARQTKIGEKIETIVERLGQADGIKTHAFTGQPASYKSYYEEGALLIEKEQVAERRISKYLEGYGVYTTTYNRVTVNDRVVYLENTDEHPSYIITYIPGNWEKRLDRIFSRVMAKQQLENNRIRRILMAEDAELAKKEKKRLKRNFG